MIDPKHECNMHRSEDEKPCTNEKGGVFSNSRDIRHSNKKNSKSDDSSTIHYIVKVGAEMTLL